jgi:hypothetical protein
MIKQVNTSKEHRTVPGSGDVSIIFSIMVIHNFLDIIIPWDMNTSIGL